MQTRRIFLAMTGLAVLSLPLDGQVLPAASAGQTAGQTAGPDFQIECQLEEVRRQLKTFQEKSAGPLHEELFQSASIRLRNLDRLYMSTRRGRPIRSDAQLHSYLSFLKVDLAAIAVDLGLPQSAETLVPATGTFSGRVTGSDAPTGLEGVIIDIFDSVGDWVGSATTIGSGNYATPGLTPGDYYARTNELTRYINELYDDIPCYFICDITADGQKITVADGLDTPDIDFELERGDTISGIITDAAVAPPNDPIEFVTVDFFDENGNWVTNPSSINTGRYVTPGMPAGTYYAVTFNLDQYLNERYDDTLCARCEPTEGTPIVIVAGIDTEDIDFELDKGGSISGTVTTDPPGSNIENVVVEIYHENGDWAATGWSDFFGIYQTGAGLLASTTYRALTYAPAPYLNVLWDNIQCYTGCDLTTGTPIAVTLGVDTPGKNFALPSGGTFSGTVTDGTTGRAAVGIEIFDTAGDWVGNTWTDGSGNYVSPGLPADNYHARTWNDQGLINELYDDIPCSFCDVTTGALIAVSGGGADNPGIDFVLDIGGTLSGTVTSTDTEDELEAVSVDIFNSSGTWIANPSTDDQGQYSSPGLPTGDYYARTWNSDGYVNELYDDMHCPPTCDPLTDGTVIGVQVGNDTAGIDFVLDTAGAIAGAVTDIGTEQPVEGMVIEIWDANGDFTTATTSAIDGSYAIDGLPAATYFALTRTDLGYVGALYDGFDCNGCSATLGTPITVVTDATTGDINFELTPGGFISGTVTETGTGLPIADIRIEVWSPAGNRLTTQATASDGTYTTTWAVPPGNYYVKTWNDQGYINENYPDMACGACFPTDGTTVNIGASDTTSGIDFDLAPGGSISGTLTLAIPDDVLLTNIQIFDDNGDWVWTQTPPTTNGEYAIPVGLPTGTYYARTASGRPHVQEVWNNHYCLACDVVATGDPIAVTSPNTTTSIDFDLDPGVKLTGTVKDVGTQLGIDDSVAEIFTLAGDRVAGCTVVSTGDFTCRQALPAGTYYAASSNYAGYIDELYRTPRTPCVGGGEFCDVAQGTPIVVTLGETPDPIHLTLDRGGWIEGSVIDERWRRGLAPTEILIYNSSANHVANVVWGRPRPQDGSYTSCGLPSGTYYAVTDVSNIGGYHANELYDDSLCVVGCNILGGTPISVVTGSGTQDIDFELANLIFADGFESNDTSAWTRSVP